MIFQKRIGNCSGAKLPTARGLMCATIEQGRYDNEESI